ncbi:uncharacterized protein LOC109863964 [Pseudomyrmex gracilis]|uniref:uncharacterized protein LOC109863964 n=1 Tax=Pseudomyrmex gracilis TaxID=219809 RepID=UPI000995AE26|nr:uncharacterized protein LOC109863964 [Pseudomyrmex gracilis]
MKICEGWFVAGWYAACALFYVCAHPARDRSEKNAYISSRSRSPESKSTADDYTYEREISSASKLSEIAEDSLEDFEETGSPTMRAIIAKERSDVVLLPLIIEPEAEMLPAGYKGVKPPGVSHMEMTYAKPQIGSSGRKNAASRNTDKSDGFDRHDDDAHYAASKHETQVAKNDRNSESFVILDGGSKGKSKKKSKKNKYSEGSESDSKTGSKKSEYSEGSRSDSKKENKKSKYSETSGVQKSHSENKDRAKNNKKEIVKKKDAAYNTRGNRKKAHTAAGYRNVYHRDEFMKDADFYDNGREGGRFEKHGRYGEKHSAAEGTYARGKNNSSRSVREVEANEHKKLDKATGVD